MTSFFFVGWILFACFVVLEFASLLAEGYHIKRAPEKLSCIPKNGDCVPPTKLSCCRDLYCLEYNDLENGEDVDNHYICAKRKKKDKESPKTDLAPTVRSH